MISSARRSIAPRNRCFSSSFVTAGLVGGGLTAPSEPPRWGWRGRSPRSNGGDSNAPLPAPEDGLALLHEGLDRLAVVVGHATAGVMPGLEVEQVLERAALGRVEVPVHVAAGDPRSPPEPRRQRHRLLLEPRARNHPIDEAELQRLGRV